MTIRERAAKWLREPLVHFLIAGALVFALLSGRSPNPGERRIVVSETLVKRLGDRWTETYRRPPAPEELDGLIRDYVKSEVYYREALRLGLDQDDEVVKRRMRSKLEAVATADAEAAAPTDADLQALLDRDPARYAADPRYEFEQVYLGADNATARAAVAGILARAQAGEAIDGQPIALPRVLHDASKTDIADQFGDEFAASLRGLPVGRWSGPVPSGFGLHLVRVVSVAAPQLATLASARRQLDNDWRAAKIRAASDEGYRKLLEGIDVVIERPR